MKTSYQYAIIGGGLAGLYAGFKLSEMGISDYVILEGGCEFGGRIKPFEAEGFDLGATWFWSEFQPELSALIDRLGLVRFNQYDKGNMLIERSIHEAPRAVRGYMSSPVSNRLQGGMYSLIEALKNRQKSTALLTGSLVQAVVFNGKTAQISVQNGKENLVLHAKTVLLALPPRLAANIEFSPALPPELSAQWQNTATWMAPHAKYVAVFDRPFWREQGLSGYGHSQHGPLGEIHDISMPDGRGCLFGFFGVPANVREQAGEAVLKAHCCAELVRLFGKQAGEPVAELIKDWSQDPLTATQADKNASHLHPIAPENTPTSGDWTGKLWGIGSEWSPTFSGYLAGAVEAVDIALQQMGVAK
ncbi:TPA: flavin monoamine oxidase family protein [Mannheimia haemolytica]